MNMVQVKNRLKKSSITFGIIEPRNYADYGTVTKKIKPIGNKSL
jgi:hypothetical protein